MTKLDNLINTLAKLQGIGRKSAIRIAFDLLEKQQDEINIFLETIKDSYNSIRPCNICKTLTDNENNICYICSDEKRNKNILCVVENTKDVLAIEKSAEFNGIYHVLGGRLDPLNGITISDLYIKELLDRLADVKEIILALNPDIEGETTILYLIKVIPKNIKISKIASGIPMGGNIEYTDIVTLAKSLEGRQVINNE